MYRNCYRFGCLDVKNVFQGIASEQKTLLVLFGEMMQEFHSRIGIDRSASTYHSYRKTHKHLERFIREKYKVRDIPLVRLDLSFIESFDFYLRVERGLNPGSTLICTIYLQKVARLALHRIDYTLFLGKIAEMPYCISVAYVLLSCF